MNLDKNKIMEMLANDGNHDKAAAVGNTLPDKVDVDSPEHQDLLSKLGVDVNDIKGKLGGLGNLI